MPAFGLNTLGGALALYTKSGAQYPGGTVGATAGAFGRRELTFEYGAAGERVDAFATARLSDDDGYALHNASRVRQFFGKIGTEDAQRDMDVSATLADNRLNGSQTLPVSFLDRPRDPYTYPDVNENRLAFVVAKGSRFLGDTSLVDGNAYYRRYRNTNVSSNVNDDFGAPDPDTGVEARTPRRTTGRPSTRRRSAARCNGRRSERSAGTPTSSRSGRRAEPGSRISCRRPSRRRLRRIAARSASARTRTRRSPCCATPTPACT
jgi:hypothetical protein